MDMLIRLRMENGNVQTAIIPESDWEITKEIALETEGGNVYHTRAEAGTYECAAIPGQGVYTYYTPDEIN